jgi:hypothetical protein
MRYGNIFIFLRQGGARAVDLPARPFDLARPGVAPPLVTGDRLNPIRDSKGLFKGHGMGQLSLLFSRTSAA